MTVLNVAVNQTVTIPEIPLEDGGYFKGQVKANDGQTLVVGYEGARPVFKSGQRDHLYIMTWGTGEKTRSCPVLVRSRGKGELNCQVVIRERRESLRARCNAGLTFSAIAPERLTETAEAVLSQVAQILEPESEADQLMRGDDKEDALRSEMVHIRRLMERISMQLENLTRVLEGSNKSSPKPDEIHAVEMIDCSATGLGFRHFASMPLGTFLHMKITFFDQPKFTVDCVGVIVRSELDPDQDAHPGQHEIGVRFTHIHEADRERIVRHIFKIQRAQLRDRHSLTAAG